MSVSDAQFTSIQSPRDGGATRHQLIIFALLCYGIAATILIWEYADLMAVDRDNWFGPERLTALCLAMAVALVPAVNKRLLVLLHKLSSPTPLQRMLVGCGVAVVTMALLLVTALSQHRDLFPQIHDDQSTLVQMQMLARGRLWMPAHPLHAFFDTFHVITQPVYASAYFPGAAMLYVPTIWFGLPSWYMPILVTGCCVGLTYRLVAEATDGVIGLLVAVGMQAATMFRVFSVLLTSHHPALLLGLLVIWAWFRWRTAADKARPWWAILVGVFSGWAAITRPVDALCFCIPVGLGIVLDFYRRIPSTAFEREMTDSPRARTFWRLAGTVGLICFGAAPFLTLQLIVNRNVTGRWLESPFVFYLNHDQPQTDYGFRDFDPSIRPQSTLPQKQTYYDTACAPPLIRHQPGTFMGWWATLNLPMFVDYVLPSFVYLPFVFVGVWAARQDRRRIVLAAITPLFFIAYLPYPFFLPHYSTLALPATLMLAAMGMRLCAGVFRTYASRLWPAVTVGWTAVALLLLPQCNVFVQEPFQTHDWLANAGMHKLQDVVVKNAALHHPSVVLCRYQPGDPVHFEPVYNTASASPDDAEIIFAHDLGESENQAIFRYYAEHQPTRYFYRWDRSTMVLTPLGYATELAAVAVRENAPAAVARSIPEPASMPPVTDDGPTRS